MLRSWNSHKHRLALCELYICMSPCVGWGNHNAINLKEQSSFFGSWILNNRFGVAGLGSCNYKPNTWISTWILELAKDEWRRGGGQFKFILVFLSRLAVAVFRLLQFIEPRAEPTGFNNANCGRWGNLKHPIPLHMVCLAHSWHDAVIRGVASSSSSSSGCSFKMQKMVVCTDAAVLRSCWCRDHTVEIIAPNSPDRSTHTW